VLEARSPVLRWQTAWAGRRSADLVTGHKKVAIVCSHRGDYTVRLELLEGRTEEYFHTGEHKGVEFPHSTHTRGFNGLEFLLMTISELCFAHIPMLGTGSNWHVVHRHAA